MINHKRARFFISIFLDNQLNASDWNQLERHLEGCQECTHYQRNTTRLENSLRQSLRAHWDGGSISSRGVALALIARQRQRANCQRQLVWAGMGTGVMCLFLLVGFVRRTEANLTGSSALIPVTANIRPVATETALSTRTVLPPPPTARFPGVVAYETSASGNEEIFLVNSGAEPLNLTENPARDSDPAWSPDGGRLAFLSDRSGKREVYLISLVNLLTVQVTHAPGIDWQGPLSWSRDGKRIALVGKEEEEGMQRSIYLIELDKLGGKADVVKIENTFGARSPEFAPSGMHMAYFDDALGTRIVILDLEAGQQPYLHLPSEVSLFSAAPGSALDWFGDSTYLVYARSPSAEAKRRDSCAQILVKQGFYVAPHEISQAVHKFIPASPPLPGTIIGVSWTASGDLVYLVVFGENGCTDPLRCRFQPDTAGLTFFFVNGLCVEGGIDRGSWTSDRRWLVVTGRELRGNQAGLYAVRMPLSVLDTSPSFLDDVRPGVIVRLADIAGESPLPRVRP